MILAAANCYLGKTFLHKEEKEVSPTVTSDTACTVCFNFEGPFSYQPQGKKNYNSIVEFKVMYLLQHRLVRL